MTEFQRAVAAVKAVEDIVEALAASISCSEDQPPYIVFAFDPPIRREPSSTGGDWVVLGQTGALRSHVTETQRVQFEEAERMFLELEAVAERLRHKCQVRIELEAAKATLRSQLPPDALPEEGILQTCEEMLRDGNASWILCSDDVDGVELRSLIQRVLTLQTAAIYGAKMKDQALDLLARLAVCRDVFETEVVPKLAQAVAVSRANLAEQERAEMEAFEAALEASQREALEEARRPVVDLLSACEEMLRTHQASTAKKAQRCSDQQGMIASARERRAKFSAGATMYTC
eukprot:TRINITY_DN4888_c0_g1_i1.p1 TRINITY_DN4888_c0_g1~~TRINITY_DN4888_c0_g1_i1.p1  ORF type:complete len:300 (+),score=63.88 TRINITY_DN4888_c0_g1_i1:35-901(+)